ncbi:toll/interleukin-1 receptor domain-containing protein [bacterium]|nr:toll/interleukin-1 receptor domain-containing protein [bacterium]
MSDNRERVSRINEALKAKGWRTWFDEQGDMRDNTQKAITAGIETTQVVLVCLTRRYMEKVASGSLSDICNFEWNLALAQKGESAMILPIVMESFDWDRPAVVPVPTAAVSKKNPVVEVDAQTKPAAVTSAPTAAPAVAPMPPSPRLPAARRRAAAHKFTGAPPAPAVSDEKLEVPPNTLPGSKDDSAPAAFVIPPLPDGIEIVWPVHASAPSPPTAHAQDANGRSVLALRSQGGLGSSFPGTTGSSFPGGAGPDSGGFGSHAPAAATPSTAVPAPAAPVPAPPSYRQQRSATEAVTSVAPAPASAEPAALEAVATTAEVSSTYSSLVRNGPCSAGGTHSWQLTSWGVQDYYTCCKCGIEDARDAGDYD